MKKTDRMLGVLLELQARRRARAEDLAARFETSKRTIYRDIQALCETGVPIVAEPGVGYSLAPGYFLPPLSFTPDEATMLMLGAGFMAQSFDAQYQAAARGAAQKIEAVLSDELQAQVRRASQRIRLMAGRPEPEEHLPLLRRAVLERRTLQFHYETRFGASGEPEENQRSADPYALIFSFGFWYLPAYCHLRQAMRYFRADRMSSVTVLDRHFVPSQEALAEPGDAIDRDRPVRVQVRFKSADLRRVRENRSWFTTAIEETSGEFVVTLRVKHEQEILPWVLGWGSRAEVLEPASLRHRVEDEAREILARC
jgi:predicted DNA-binding transcriptional regulator YafY